MEYICVHNVINFFKNILETCNNIPFSIFINPLNIHTEASERNSLKITF